MALTDESAALRARQLMTERGESTIGMTIPKIIANIPVALEMWAREAIKVPNKRREFEQSIEIDLINGVADVSQYLDGDIAKIDRSSFNGCANVQIEGLDTPIKWVNSLTQLKYSRSLSGVFVTLFLDGETLRTRNIDGSLTSLNGALNGTFIVTPTDVSDVPFNLEGDFLTALAQVSMSEMGIIRTPPKTR